MEWSKTSTFLATFEKLGKFLFQHLVTLAIIVFVWLFNVPKIALKRIYGEGTTFCFV